MSSTTQTSQLEVVRPDPNACFPKHSPAWRWNVATYVCDWYSGDPPNSDDPWVQEAATFLRQCLQNWSDASGEPTLPQRVIAEACAVHSGNSVQRAILESRLLVNETYDEIAERSAIPGNVVEAFEQLFFNVTEPECREQFCSSRFRPEHLLPRPHRQREIGPYLHMLAGTEGAAGVEAVAELLGRLDGKTFAKGLAGSSTTASRMERARRVLLIQGLGLFKRKQLKQIQSLLGAMPNVLLAVGTASDEKSLLWDELLKQVCVPTDIRQYATSHERSAAANFAA
jgi:hypothetical protein